MTTHKDTLPIWTNSDIHPTPPKSGTADSVAWGSPNERNGSIMESKTFYSFVAPAICLPVIALSFGLGWAIIQSQ